jgi:hypothetical protein
MTKERMNEAVNGFHAAMKSKMMVQKTDPATGANIGEPENDTSPSGMKNTIKNTPAPIQDNETEPEGP